MTDLLTPAPPTFPGPVNFPMTAIHPVSCAIDVQPHPTGCVQLSVTHAAGVTIVFLPNDVAERIAGIMASAAKGLVLADTTPSPLLQR